MNSQILVLCPSRSRPKQCLTMVESFNATAKRSSLRLLLDMDDPCLEEYRATVGGKVGNMIIDFQKPITELINQSWNCGASYKWLSVTNDDFVYKTDGWDEELIKTLDGRPGIVYGNDLLQGRNLPTTSVISREIVEALGWLQMPGLTHLFGDNVWKHLGEKAGCLFYRPNVIIEHRHWNSGKVQIDEISKRVNSGAMFDRDQLAFLKWLQNQAPADIEKIKEVVRQSQIPA